MRLHKPVPGHLQPHLQGLFQGGIPDNGRASPNSIATSSGSYDDGGTVTPAQNTGSAASNEQATTRYWNPETKNYDSPTPPPDRPTEKPKKPGMFGDGLVGGLLSRAAGSYDAGGVVDPNAFVQWPNEKPGFEDGGSVDGGGGGGDYTSALIEHANQVYQDHHKQLEEAWRAEQGGGEVPLGDQPTDQGFARGGTVNKVNNDNDDGDDPEERKLATYYARGGGVKEDMDAEERALAKDDWKYDHYARGGKVKKKQPQEPLDKTIDKINEAENNGDVDQGQDALGSLQQGQGRGEVEQQGTMGERRTQDLDYPGNDALTGRQLLTVGDFGAGPDSRAAMGYAQGGIPAPPGPAGPGVRPQAPTGNAGRPNFTAPDPARVSQEKNYAQNITSRPATSPMRGTAFSQPGPDGGQRGQEWYGKGSSPYGKGRKTKNG